MLNKKVFFIFLLMIISIGAISSVSANNSTDEIGTSGDDFSEGNVEIATVGSGSNVILESSDNGTFTALQNKIDSAGEGSEISLDGDYYYNDDFENLNGVEITKSLTINGNGHVISGLSKSSIFFINGAENLILNNITFKDAFYANGAIFLFSANNFSCVDCNFIDNDADTGNGGAVTMGYVDSSSFIGCSFVNNRAGGRGGAINMLEVKSSSFEGCEFTNNSAVASGGAIFANKGNGFSARNCNFTNNSCFGSGGAILLDGAYSSSIVNCTFIGNYASSNMGLTSWILRGGEVANFTIGDDAYVHSSASHGGAVFLNYVNQSEMDHCRFNHNFACGAGGSVYFQNVDDSNVADSIFLRSFGIYAGTIHCENSNVVLEKAVILNSESYNFGGAIGSRFSNFTLNNSVLNAYYSYRGEGGAVYSFRGNTNIANSSFVLGYSKFGGAIANSQANLTVLSSRFVNHIAGYGGAIYSVHGNVFVNDSFFNNSQSRQGSAVFCSLSNYLVFTNNIFINSSGGQFVIYSMHSNMGIVESGNHFENLYHIRMIYTGYYEGKEFTVKSKIINYVVSNDGKYLNTYNCKDDWVESEYASLDIFDLDNPANSTIFGDFNDDFRIKFLLDKNYDSDDYEYLYIDMFSDSDFDNQIEKIDDIKDSMYVNMNFTFRNRTAFEYDDLTGYNGVGIPVSLINSSLSDSDIIPSYYNSRDYGYVTPVKDQGDAGNCWAFSGLATLETCIKKATGITYDFSENNPKNLMALDSITGLTIETNSYGYDSMIMGYLNSWLGPINERTDTYDSYSSISSVYASLFEVQNIKFIPPRVSNFDNNQFKKAIMDYGAVSVAFATSPEESHAVSLVGWDDSYRGYDCVGTYAREGAWIFKNSWGVNWGDGGYGYLAYRTPFLSDDYDFNHAYTFVFNKWDCYLKNYQYDYSGLTDFLVNYRGHIYYSNKFVCNESSDYDELLVAFSTYFAFPTNYTVSLYINCELMESKCGYSEAGYYTIPFNRIYDIEKGDEFKIVIECRNEGKNYAPVCKASELNIANVKPNLSFVSYDGENWIDLYDVKKYCFYLNNGTQANTRQVACIKAFTCWYYAYVVDLDVSEFDTVDVNQKVRVDMSLYGDHYYFDTEIMTNGSLVTITIDGRDYYAQVSDGWASVILSFDKPGKYTFSARYANNRFLSNPVEFNFTVTGDAIISAKDISKVYGGSEKSVITLKDEKGNLIKDTVIYFRVNGKTTPIKTNALGQASMPISLAPDTYTATISYGGDGIYNCPSKKVKIVVKKATPKMTAASKKTYKVKTKTKSYAVTLKNNLGKVMKSTKITLKVNGKTYSAKTNSKGVATFKLTKLTKKGSFKATITYAGSKYYNKVTKKATIYVK